MKDLKNKMNKWKPTKVNQSLMMSRVDGNTIAVKPLNWLEKIIYWRRRVDYGRKNYAKRF